MATVLTIILRISLPNFVVLNGNGKHSLRAKRERT